MLRERGLLSNTRRASVPLHLSKFQPHAANKFSKVSADDGDINSPNNNNPKKSVRRVTSRRSSLPTLVASETGSYNLLDTVRRHSLRWPTKADNKFSHLVGESTGLPFKVCSRVATFLDPEFLAQFGTPINWGNIDSVQMLAGSTG
jgi:hypothetical protein